MTPDLRKQLQRVTWHQQRKIWLKRIACRIPPLFWWSASVLFLGGFIHQLILPLSLLLVACIAILPSLLIFSWVTATEKPTADQGAAAADRLFGANSLFVTTWEFSRSTIATEGIEPLLSARAETLLPGWLQLIEVKSRLSMKPASLIAATLAIIGLFFLMLPAHVQIQNTPYTTAYPQKLVMNQADESASVLSDLFMENEKTATEYPAHQDEQGQQQNTSGGTSPHTPPESKQSTSVEISEKLSRSHGQPPSLYGTPPTTPEVFQPGASTAKGKKLPGQTPGMDSAKTSDKVISKADEFEQIQLIDIDTGKDSHATAFDGAREGSDLIVFKPQQSTSRRFAPSHSQKNIHTQSTTQLTAQQRTSVRRYFKQLEKINDPSR